MNRGTALKWTLVVVIAAVALPCAAVLWLKLAPRHVPVGQPDLTILDVGSLPAFREAFNSGGGETRVLVLLSPT